MTAHGEAQIVWPDHRRPSPPHASFGESHSRCSNVGQWLAIVDKSCMSEREVVTARISTKLDKFVAELQGNRTFVLERDGHLIQHALVTHSVVVIRGMEVTPAEQVALTRLLGEPEVVTDMRNHHPESVHILVVSNSGGTPVVGNQCWHSDCSFLPKPVRYTTLRAHVVPLSGGDTLFADMVAAYEQAPSEWKAALISAMGVHTYDKIARLRAQIHNKPIEKDYDSKYPPVRHPIVRSHPETEMPALYVNPLCLARIESEHGAPVGISVDELHTYAVDEKFVYRHQWQSGDVLIWDNSRLIHRAAILPPGLPRVMHRTSTVGSAPQGYMQRRYEAQC